MNLSRWCLLLAAVPIVLGAQLASSYRSVVVSNYLDRPDGSGVAVLRSRDKRGSELIAWDANLQNCRSLLRESESTDDSAVWIASNPGGTRIVVPQHDGLACLDTITGDLLWKSKSTISSLTTKRVDFVNAGKHVVVTFADSDLGSTADAIVIIDALTGEFLENAKYRQLSRFLVQKDRVAIQYGRDHPRYGEWDLIEILPAEAVVVKSVAYAPPSMLPGATYRGDQREQSKARGPDLDVSMMVRYGDRWQDTQRLYASHPPTVLVRRPTMFLPGRLQAIDAVGGKRMRVQRLGYGETLMLLLVTSLAAAAWAIVLVIDGKRSAWPWRVLVDSLLVLGLIALICSPLGVFGWTESPSPERPSYVLRSAPVFFSDTLTSLFAAAGLSACLAGLLWQRRKLYLWIAFFAACALPVLLPLISIVALIVQMDYRFRRKEDQVDPVNQSFESTMVDQDAPVTNRKKWRFGIGEMMLATACIAVFIAVGQMGMFLIARGVLLAGLFAAAVVVSEKSINTGSLFVTVFLVAFLSAGHQQWRLTGSSVFAFAVPMFFALASVHGYRIQQMEPASQPADSAEKLEMA